MPKGLVRFQKSADLHCIPFSRYRRRPLLNHGAAYRTFERELDAVRRRDGLVVAETERKQDAAERAFVHPTLCKSAKDGAPAVLVRESK